MKYFVTFQQYNPNNGRPTDHPTSSDFETDDKGFGMIPNVGDYVSIHSIDGQSAAYDGKVKSRLFRYFARGDHEDQHCGINIVVEDAPNDDWGALIKE